MSLSLSLSTLLTARLCLCLSRVFQWHVSVLKPPHLSSQTSTKRTQMDYFTLLQSLCVSLLLFFTFLFSIKWKTINQSSPSKSGRSPPSPKALPIIGHLHLLTDLPHMSLTTLAHQLGPIIHLRLGRVPTLVVSSAHYARLVLKTHDHVFATRPQLLAAQYLSFGCSDVTFSPYGSYWRQARKICVTELLSTKRISSFRTVRDEEVNGMLNSVLAQSKSEAVDMSKLFFTLANDVLCRVAFGKRFVEGSGEGKKCHVAEVLAETQALLAGFSVGDFFPECKCVNWVCGLKGRLEKNLKDLRRVCDEIIGEHTRNDGLINNGSTTKVREEDLVDVLIRVQKRHDLEVPITNDNLKALVLDMFVAGTDTTATTLEWTMTELMRHPREFKKAQQQVREVASNSGKVEESHLHQLPYVKAAVKEAMRLHPPVPLLVPRESMDDCDLDGYQIPAKTRVLINAYAIGRDPDSWEDPLMYKPGRFEEDAVGVKDHDFRFLAFGGGRRGCPGYGFALATVEIALARLLYHFDWSLPGDDGPDDVDLDEIFGLATRKKSALILVPTPNMDYQLMGVDGHY